jgi:hypothetical protein
MHKSAVLATLAVLAAVPAFAQEAPYSKTLDEQLQRVKEGKSAVPAYPGTAAKAAPAAAPAVGNTSSGLSHKASPLNTSMTPPPAAPKPAPIAYDKHGQPIESTGSGAIPALPLQEMISGEIHFITGGVGDEEIDQLGSVESQFNFHLLITASQGEYISGATLRLRDASGADVLATDNAGPYFYARLKPGNYSLDVITAKGMKQTVPVNVKENVTLKKTVQFNNV